MWNIYIQSKLVGQVGGANQAAAKNNAARMFNVSLGAIIAKKA